MKRETVKHRVKILFVFWLFSAVFVVYQNHYLNKYSSLIHQLFDDVSDVQSIFSLEEHYIVRHSDQLQVKHNEIKRVANQLMSLSVNSMLLPDTAQLNHSTLSYINLIFRLIDIQVNFAEFASNNRRIQANKQISNARKLDYYKVEMLTFHSLLEGADQEPDIYRQLNDLYTKSLAWSVDEQQRFQTNLAMATMLLERYANQTQLVDKILSTKLLKELEKCRVNMHQIQDALLYAFAILSALFSLLVYGLFSRYFMLNEAVRSHVEPIEKPLTDECHEVCDENHEVLDGAESRERATADHDNFSGSSDDEHSGEPITFDYLISSLNHDMESVGMLLQLFHTNHSKDIQLFKQALLTDRNSALEIIHALKGVTGSIGAKRLHMLADRAEQQLKSGDVPDESFIDEMEAEIQNVVDSIDNFIKSH